MTVVERLREVVERLPEEAAQQVLEFAEALASETDDAESWRESVLELMASRYGDDEPEYTLADIIRR